MTNNRIPSTGYDFPSADPAVRARRAAEALKKLLPAMDALEVCKAILDRRHELSKAAAVDTEHACEAAVGGNIAQWLAAYREQTAKQREWEASNPDPRTPAQRELDTLADEQAETIRDIISGL
mgnify:CR=1 FL=1